MDCPSIWIANEPSSISERGIIYCSKVRSYIGHNK